MLRVIVSVLAAFVGFSFGHSIPKWMESRRKTGSEMQSPSWGEPAHRMRKQPFRRKPLRKFKFGLQKPGKEKGEGNGSSHKLCDDAQLVISPQHDRLHKVLQFPAAERSPMDKSSNACLDQALDSSAKRPLSATHFVSQCHLSDPNPWASLNSGCHRQQAAPSGPTISRHGLSEVSSSQQNAMCIPQQEVEASGAVACKSSSLQSSRCSPSKEKSQMKQWKMKLLSLRSKAMASEKVWYQKFEGEGCGGKLSVSSPTGPVVAMKKTAKGKENESPHLTKTKRRDFFWSRSSSRVGLLVEGPKSALER